MRLAIVDSDRCVGCQSCMFACNRRQGSAGLGKTCIMVRSSGGMEKGFTLAVCRACPDPPCAKVCPAKALTVRSSGGVKLHKNKCNGCGDCLAACTLGAIFWDEETNKPLICTYCGYCADYCPHGVIELEKVKTRINQ